MAIEMRVEKITPELARHYLKRNVDNYRKISRAKVALYAEEMKAGKWQLNGESIMMDETGRLKNGQHRLAAIILANVPVEMTVMTGISDDVSIFDSGMTRSTKQIAEASGCGDITTTEAAAATAFVGRFDKVPKGLVLDWLKDNYPEVRRAYRVCGAGNKKGLSCRVSCVVMTYMILTTDMMKSYELETFFKVFNSGNVIGAEGYEPSSALVARRMFADRYKGNATNKRTLIEQAEILLQATGDFKKGKKRQLNYQIKEPLQSMELLDRCRKAHGLDRKGATA